MLHNNRTKCNSNWIEHGQTIFDEKRFRADYLPFIAVAVAHCLVITIVLYLSPSVSQLWADNIAALGCRWLALSLLDGAESFAVQINCSGIWLIHIIHANWQSFTLPFSLIRAIRNAKPINNTRMRQSEPIL